MSKKRQSPKRAQKTTANSQKDLKLLLGIGLVLALGAVLFLIFRPGAPEDSEPVNAADSGAELVPADSYVFGPPDAPVQIVEFLDPECEACRAMHPIVKQALERYQDDVNLVVRYFPLHRNSVLAARALEAAGLQDKYWEMLDVLFQMQPEWGEKAQPQNELMLHYAAELGLDMERFEKDFNNAEFETKVARDRADGIAMGVRGTPTFFINGTLAGTGMSLNQLSSKIEAELAK